MQNVDEIKLIKPVSGVTDLVLKNNQNNQRYDDEINLGNETQMLTGITTVNLNNTSGRMT